MDLTESHALADRPRMERVSDNAFTLDHLDRWMRYAVLVLHRGGIQTYESCQGGRGHAFPEPTIRFEGTQEDAFRAARIARANGLPAHHLRRFWRLNDEGAELPAWELTFHPLRHLIMVQRRAEKAGLETAAAPHGDETAATVAS